MFRMFYIFSQFKNVRIFRTFPVEPLSFELFSWTRSFSRPTDTFDIRRTGSAVCFRLLDVPFVTAFCGDRVTDNAPVDPEIADDVWRRESESRFLTFVVSESRFERGSGDDVTYLLELVMPEGMLTTVVEPYAEGGELFPFGDDDILIIGLLLDMGIDELRLLLRLLMLLLFSIEMLRQLWTESGRVKLVSFLLSVMDEGSLDFWPLYRLLVLFVRLLFDCVTPLPLGGFAIKPFIPANGILLGLLRRGVSGHFDRSPKSLSCWSCADSVELLFWNASSIVNGIMAFMLGVEIVWRFGVDVCIIVMPSWEDSRVEWCSGLDSDRFASFDSITRSWALVPSSSMFRSSIYI